MQTVTSVPDAVERSSGTLNNTDLVARRHLTAGTLLRGSMLERPLAVRRGDRVSIVSTRPGLTIESVGVAQSNARVGDAVQVRNASSQRLVQAWAIARGVVGTTPNAPGPNSVGPGSPHIAQTQSQAKVLPATGR